MLQTEKEFQKLNDEFIKFKRDVTDALSNIGRENMDEEMQYYIFTKIDAAINGYKSTLDGINTEINNINANILRLDEAIKNLKSKV